MLSGSPVSNLEDGSARDPSTRLIFLRHTAKETL